MNYEASTPAKNKYYPLYICLALLVIVITLVAFFGFKMNSTASADNSAKPAAATSPEAKAEEKRKSDSLMALAMAEEYDRKIIHITNGDSSGKWPVKTPYPLPGAILPFKRIVS